MDDTQKDIFVRGLFVIIITAILSTICYFFFDIYAAVWLYNHHIFSHEILKKITLIPDILEILAILIYVSVFISWLFNRRFNFLTPLLHTANCIVITNLFKIWAKVLFGRYWPKTWIDNNPSLIHTGDYGFNFFHTGVAFQSFPSGHTAITVTAMTALALFYPRLRIPALIIALAVPISLVILDHHFISDTIAGAGLGCVIAYWYCAMHRDDEIESQLLELIDE